MMRPFQDCLKHDSGETKTRRAIGAERANLTAWATITTNALPASGVVPIADPQAADFSLRYYRAVKVP